MKNVAIIFFVLIEITMKTSAQIPNNGFENWTSFGNCLEPTGWFSTNMADTNASYFPVTRSTDHFPASVGSYSIRLESNPLLTVPQKWGMAWPGDVKGSDYPTFHVIGHPSSFCGYYKFFPQNNDTMRIFICLFSGGTEVTQAKITSSATASSWTSFSIPIPSYTNADSARIFLSSFYSDGPLAVQGNSILYVDNLSFDNLITSIQDQTSDYTPISLYPNPASDIVKLKINNSNITDLKLTIYNVMGVLVKTEILRKDNLKINTVDLSNGIYLLAIKSKDLTEMQKLIIQR
ncbi:MAG: T9SS type A sorting domain-containing protein [Bacteroidota bacterium]